MFQLGQEVIHKTIPHRHGVITTNPFGENTEAVQRVAWSDGSEGWYHHSEIQIKLPPYPGDAPYVSMPEDL